MLAHHRLADGADGECGHDQHRAVAEADGELGDFLLDLLGRFTPRVEVEIVLGGTRDVGGDGGGIVPHGLSPPLG